MFIFLMGIHIFVSLVLIGVILMQAGRGGGVSEIFGGSSTKTIFGTSATNFLTRATAVCAVVFIVTSLSLAILSSKRSKSLMESKGAALMDIGETVGFPVEEVEDVPYEEAGDVSVMPAEDEKEPIEPISE